MPFCSNCGTELPEDAAFCPKCGTPTKSAVAVAAPGGVVYRRGSSWGAGRVLAIVFGGLILLVALGLIAGGGAILWSQSAFADNSGYMMTSAERLNVASYAIVQSDLNIYMGNAGFTNPAVRDIVSVKISVTSNNGKPVFIGVATQQYAQSYLNGVNIDKLISYEWVPNRFGRLGTPTYQTIPGGNLTSLPLTQAFWVAQASGTGTQTLTWTPTTGDYWVVVMNENGSPGVDVDAQVGARIGFLGWIGGGILIGGMIAALVGVVILYFGAFRRR
jgi:hypothetical protein